MKTVLMWLLMVTGVSYGGQDRDHSKDRSLSLLESIAVGSAAGATEVALTGQPLSYRTNMKTLNQPCSLKPAHWYKGFAVNLGGMAPITALQKVGRVQGEKMLQERQTEELSDLQKLSVACAAGAISSVVATPSEAVPVYMQYMQKAKGISLTPQQAFKMLKLQAWRGLSTTAFRDAGFTAGYATLAGQMEHKAKEVAGDSSAVKVTSGVATGGAVALATHPCAVVKTMLQRDPFKETHKTAFDAAKSLYQKEGVRGFFRGMSGRGPRIMIAVPLLNEAEKQYSKLVTGSSQ